MERHSKKNPDGLGEITFTAQGDSDRGELEATFPRTMPSTHRLGYRWDGPNAVTVGPVPAPDAPPPPAAGQGKALAEMTEKELITLGAELGLPLKKSQTKADMIALIIEKQRASQPE